MLEFQTIAGLKKDGKINISLERRKENSSGWFVTEINLKILALVSAGLGHVPHVALPTEKLGLVLHLVWVVSHHVDVVERDMLGGEREQRGR